MGDLAVGGVSRFAEIDAVTIDGHGTLLAPDDPIGHLQRALRLRGVERARADVERGFEAEFAYYREHKLAARDAESLAELRRGSARVFLDELGVDLDPDEFASAFDLPFAVLEGAAEAVRGLAARGLALAVVANWDFGVHEHLERTGLRTRFGAIVVSAEVGAAKPAPAPFRVALERIGVPPHRAVHVGDDQVDEQGAAAAGLAFRPAPLATAFEGWS
jgi:HAD superfamily hydrolase (TIGR01549 family)